MKFFSKLHFVTVFTLMLSFCSGALAQTPAASSLGGIFVNKGDAPLSAVQAIADAQKTTQPAYKSNGEETLFYDVFFKAHSNNSKLALLSDDGTSVWIDDEQVLSGAGQGQGFDQAGAVTFYSLSKTFVKDEIYHVRLEYTNTIHAGDVDVDGISLWAYDGGGEIVDGPIIKKLQYKKGEGAWQDVPEKLYVAVGSDLEFKAIKTPTEGEWPAGKPTWSSGGSGVSGADGAGETKTVTFAQVSSSVGDTRTVTATCNNSKSANVVVYSVNISASGLTEEQDESPGASVALNDDFDNGQLADYSSSSGYRRGEPIMDRDRNQYSPQENDLLPVTLSVSPADLPGQAQLTGGGLAVYLWPSAQKGSVGQIIDTPQSYQISALPKTVYVEGKYSNQGTVSLTLKATIDGKEASDILNVNVVTLVEKQGGQRRVINNYDETMEFQVVGGPAASEYRWDLDGDGTRNSGVFETGTTQSSRNVSYGPAQSASSVLLPRDAAHKRQDYSVSVELTGGLVLTRQIHVALDGFYGTPLTGVTVAQRNAEVTGAGATATGFNNTPPNTGTLGAPTLYSQEYYEMENGIILNINAGNHLQYGPLVASNGLTDINLPGNPGASRRVYLTSIGYPPYDLPTQQTREDVTASIDHENLHVAQFVASRDDANSVWRQLEMLYGGDYGMLQPFAEAQCHASEVNSGLVGWYHLRGTNQNDLVQFYRFYNRAVDSSLPPLAAPHPVVYAAARELLQNIYQNITPNLSPQMKTYGWVNGYDYTVRPPL